MCDNYLPYVSESVWKGWMRVLASWAPQAACAATRNPSKPFLRHKVHIRVKGKGFKGAGRQWERARVETLQLRREMYFQRRNDRPGRKTEPEKARDADRPELEIFRFCPLGSKRSTCASCLPTDDLSKVFLDRRHTFPPSLPSTFRSVLTDGLEVRFRPSVVRCHVETSEKESLGRRSVSYFRAAKRIAFF